MPQHWEFASTHATGDYLIILTDRFVVRPGALQLIASAIAGYGLPDIVTWNTESGLDSDGRFHQRHDSGTVTQRDPRNILQEFASGAQWRSTLLGSNSLPRGLNSAVRRELITAIRAEQGVVYAPLSPDYTSAFALLGRARSETNIDLPLLAAHGEESNGASIMRDGTESYTRDFALDPFEGCPLNIDTVVNTTFRDYLWAARRSDASFPAIDLPGYLLINLRELQLKRELGSKLDVDGMERQILEAASALGKADRARFKVGRAEIASRSTPAFRFRNRLARAGLLEPVKALAAGLALRRKPASRRYADVCEAVADNPLPPLTF